MAKALGLNLITKGVETEYHKLLPIEEGCKNFQGFYFGKAVTVYQFMANLIKIKLMPEEFIMQRIDFI